jgi:hypothetical protein
MKQSKVIWILIDLLLKLSEFCRRSNIIFTREMKRTSFVLFFLLSEIFLLVYRCGAELFLTDFAGDGSSGYLGENLPATSTEIYPRGLW